MAIYKKIIKAKAINQKLFALLIDPDKCDFAQLPILIQNAVSAKVDLIFVGGSLLLKDKLDDCLQQIKDLCDIPTLIFPGNVLQVSKHADGILLLSMISGRNPDLLIGQHVIAAPFLHQSDLEIISTGYMLIDGGVPTSVSYMSNTTPIPNNKKEIALCTALAGQQLGLKVMYLDTGSGAKHTVDEKMIEMLSTELSTPLIIGGGIKTPETAYRIAKAGADVVVVGNIIEKDPELLEQMVNAVHLIHVKQNK